MKELLGIAMDFKSLDDNHWWDHIATDSINHLQVASTLNMQKQTKNSLAKEPISTRAKRATQTLDTNDKKSRSPVKRQRQL